MEHMIQCNSVTSWCAFLDSNGYIKQRRTSLGYTGYMIIWWGLLMLIKIENISRLSLHDDTRSDWGSSDIGTFFSFTRMRTQTHTHTHTHQSYPQESTQPLHLRCRWTMWQMVLYGPTTTGCSWKPAHSQQWPEPTTGTSRLNACMVGIIKMQYHNDCN